jgi:predicted heme/steroid binding protein
VNYLTVGLIRMLNSSDATPLKEYTKNQLALRNGQDKPEIWCAFKGIIYDVSKSKLWRNGKHYEHWAGQDLTDEMKDAPHTINVFDTFTIVGKLK